MKRKTILQVQVALAVFLSLIPWHEHMVTRGQCDREKSSLVRKVVAKRWLPILKKVGASFPLECPFHPARNLFAPQEANKLHFPPQWTCGFCGKAFYLESQLDKHFDNRHIDRVNEEEDSVCLAEFCDVMRCEVLQERMSEFADAPPPAVDHMDDRPPPKSLSRSYYAPAWRQMPRTSSPMTPSAKGSRSASTFKATEKAEGASCSSQSPEKCDAHNPEENFPREEDGAKMYLSFQNYLKRETCDEDHLAFVRNKCQTVIHQCIGGLVVNLSREQLREVEAAMHRGVCWYLFCERYWEAGSMEAPTFPWGLVTCLVLLLTLGVSLCYYVVWVLCESHEPTSSSPTTTTTPVYSSPGMKRSPNTPSFGGSNKRMSRSKSYLAPSHSRFGTGSAESESECWDSGFNEGCLYPDAEPVGHSGEMDGHSYRSRHYSEDSRASGPSDDLRYLHEERVYNYATSFTPNYEQRRLRRNRYNYLDDFDNYDETDAEEPPLCRERSDSFIYVPYPQEGKKQSNDRR